MTKFPWTPHFINNCQNKPDRYESKIVKFLMILAYSTLQINRQRRYRAYQTQLIARIQEKGTYSVQGALKVYSSLYSVSGYQSLSTQNQKQANSCSQTQGLKVSVKRVLGGHHCNTIKDGPKNEEDPKNEDNPKNEDKLKNKDDPKNEDNPRNEDDPKKDNPKI